jgi:ribose-phosphate pyrophosphokinase
MDIAIFSLGGNDALAQKIAAKVGVPLGKVKLKTFSDGEQYVQFEENIRGRNVYLIQSTNPPAENWTRLFLALDAARGASAKEVTAVIPYFGYARQERKSKPREAIAARTFAMILDELGTDHMLTMDLHTDSIGGFFRDTNVDYLYARPVFINQIREVSDAGSNMHQFATAVLDVFRALLLITAGGTLPEYGFDMSASTKKRPSESQPTHNDR